MRNENRGANKREVADQLREGMDTDSSNEDSRGSSTETVSANLDGFLCQESDSSNGESPLLSEEGADTLNQNNWHLYLKSRADLYNILDSAD